MITTILCEITSATVSRVAAASASDPDGTLTLIINSQGGDLKPTLELVNVIRGHGGVSIGQVNGRCNSAATLVLASCQIRRASSRARFSLHETEADAANLRVRAGRLTARALNHEAADLAQLDEICRKQMAGFIGCDLHKLEGLERQNAVLSAVEALEIGLLNEVSDLPLRTVKARQRRLERIAARKPVKFTGAEMRQMLGNSAMRARAIGIAPRELRNMLAAARGS